MGKIEDKDIVLHIDRETLLQEYIPKDQYEARLKADKVAMLIELKQEIEELEKETDSNEFAAGWLEGVNDSQKVIKNRIEILKAVLQKINALRGGEENE